MDISDVSIAYRSYARGAQLRMPLEA